MAVAPLHGRSVIGGALERISAELESVADVNPLFTDPQELARSLVELSAVKARAAELELRILASSGQVAVDAGARDMGDWLAAATNMRPEDGRRALRLAEALQRRPALALAMREGRVHRDQALVIATDLDQLEHDTDDEIPADVLALAEQQLIAYAADFNPTQLHHLARHVIEVVAPELCAAHEARALARMETEAHRKSTLTMRARGDGTTRIVALVPDAVAGRLARYLQAHANPRRAHLHPEDNTRVINQMPIGRKAAEAFASFLEAVDPTRLPVHGGDATTVVITMTLEDLRSELGTALIDTHLPGDATNKITASEARRLACNATLIPAVLGSRSEVLDLGRASRLHSAAQRRAMGLRQRTCAAHGCSIPSSWCEAHHWDPWSRGGTTTVKDGGLLCSQHHHLVHDPRFRAERHPDGSVRFHARR